MNVLVITDPFYKPLYVPRMRYLCNFLVRQGHHVELYSEETDKIDFQHTYQLTTWRFINSKTDWIIKTFWTLLTDYKDRWLARKIIMHTKSIPDIVIASTSYTFPLPAADIVARHFKCPLLVDLRDIAEQAPDLLINRYNLFTKPFVGIYNKINTIRRNNVLRKAHAVTTVSPWHQKFLEKFNPNTHLVYNGYDKSEFFPNPQHAKQFRIVYAGRIYNDSVRNPELLFKALKNIKSNNEMPELIVEWYTDEHGQKIIRDYAKHYDVESLMSYHDYVPRREINNVYNSSSVVLVLSNKASKKGPFGILTTKFFEALGAQRPILVVQSDEADLESVINETNAGCAAKNTNDILHFLHLNYDVWKHNGYTIQKSKSDNFDREKQSLLFLHLIGQLNQTNLSTSYQK